MRQVGELVEGYLLRLGLGFGCVLGGGTVVVALRLGLVIAVVAAAAAAAVIAVGVILRVGSSEQTLWRSCRKSDAMAQDTGGGSDGLSGQAGQA